MRNGFKMIALAMLLGQSLGAQTHVIKPTSKPLTWYTETGTGIAGEFEIKSTASNNTALYATTSGTGSAGAFFTSGNGDGVDTFSGGGNAIYGASETGCAATFLTNGTADGLFAVSGAGTGVHGVGSGSANSGVYVYNNDMGNGVTGVGLVGIEGDTTGGSGSLAGLFNGNVNVNGQVYAWSYAINSDARYKTRIATLTHALDKVLALRGVTYDWRTEQFPDKNFGKGQQVGFIAQEVEKILPQIVSKDRNGYRAVDYSKMAPVLVEAIKEQQAQIQQQQAQLQRQQIQIKEQANVNHAQQQQIVAIAAQVRQVQAAAFSGKAPALGALLALGAGSGLVFSRRRRKS
jgi:hypothetical protein